jgi:uncharacterized protein (TIGR04255 family)
MAATHPFADKEPGNIPLSSAPLVRTIAQIKYPLLTQFSINGDAVASAVARALIEHYPLLEVGHEVSVIITADGPSEQRSATPIWRLVSADRAWQITFTGTFLSIDTTKYVHRRDFAQRLTNAWEALNQHVAVPYIERLGVRYINQVTDKEQLSRLDKLLRPEMLGIALAQDPDEAKLATAITEAQYRFPDDAAFTARWGMLPANTNIENASPPFDHSTWILDMDSFHEFKHNSNSGKSLFEDVRALALRGYQFFRWAVTEDFISTFGGSSEHRD